MFARSLLFALLVLALDQISKEVLIAHLQNRSGPVHVTSFFNLVMVWNTGVSFGLFQDMQYGQFFFAGLSGIIVLFLLKWLAGVEDTGTAFALALIIGGAIGNVIDRFRFGAVADFFDFYIGDLHWPAFNIADAAVFTGAMILCMVVLFGHKGEGNNP
ncbi:MAG: signal peptidase II [Hyphomicrobiales bacterium]|nr:signal peptidase II [Hyphomicrobiales bacterium]